MRFYAQIPELPMPPKSKVLYLDVDGVLQYADEGQWRPRLEADEFLAWAVQHFECRWLTAWARPNQMLPQKLGLRIPEGIREVKWQADPASPRSCKASAIRCDEDWFWLEDAPSEYDLAELCRRKQSWRLVRVNPSKPFILMGQIRQLLEKHLNARPYAD